MCCRPWGSQRVGHDLAAEQQQQQCRGSGSETRNFDSGKKEKADELGRVSSPGMG